MPINLKGRKDCQTCQLVRAAGGAALSERLAGSRAFIPGGESLAQIAREIGVSWQAVRNHCQKHMAVTADERDERVVRRAAQRIEIVEARKIIQHREVNKLILEKGYEALEEGKVKMSLAGINTATKYAAEQEQRDADKKLKYLAMIEAFQSGEAAREIVPAIDA